MLELEHVDRMAPFLDSALRLNLLSHLCESYSGDRQTIYLRIWDIVQDSPLVNFGILTIKQLGELGIKGLEIEPLIVKERMALEFLKSSADRLRRNENSDDDLPLKCASVFYSLREYAEAVRILSKYSETCPKSLRYDVYWGLALSLLGETPQDAIEPFDLLVSIVRDGYLDGISKLNHLCWLLHLSVPVFNHQVDGYTRLLELALSPDFRHVLESVCPWLLRYLVVASALTNQMISNVTELCTQERHALPNDPFLCFYDRLYASDFEAAGNALKTIKSIIHSDLYLSDIVEKVVESLQRLACQELSKVFSVLPNLDLYLGSSTGLELCGITIGHVEDVQVAMFKPAITQAQVLAEKLDNLSLGTKELIRQFYK